MVAAVEDELAPELVGQDARRVNEAWERMYNGPRFAHASDRGRSFPVLGRRGLNVSAMSGIDMALWDLIGKSLEVPVVELWGGACRPEMPAYASGGWADVDGIGAQLQGYVDKGFESVKMRVGVVDNAYRVKVGHVRGQLARLNAMTDPKAKMRIAGRLVKEVDGLIDSLDTMEKLAGRYPDELSQQIAQFRARRGGLKGLKAQLKGFAGR